VKQHQFHFISFLTVADYQTQMKVFLSQDLQWQLSDTEAYTVIMALIVNLALF